MPQYNAVKDLQSLASERFAKYLIDVAFDMKNDSHRIREYFINNIPAKIRTHIIQCAKNILENVNYEHIMGPGFNYQKCTSLFAKRIRKTDMSKWNSVLNALLDQRIQQLPVITIFDSMEQEFVELVDILSSYDTDFSNFSLHFSRFFKHDDFSVFIDSMRTVQRSLSECLASKLNTLVIPGICNDNILKVLGKKAVCLKHLDIRHSPDVTFIGIKWLLIKCGVLNDMSKVSKIIICRKLNKLSESELNACSFTLEELLVCGLRINQANICMILTCVKRLKFVGYLNQFYELSDALVTVWKNSSKSRVFQLTDIECHQLTLRKLNVFEECLPHVKVLKTKFSSVFAPQDFGDPAQRSMFWGHVEKLIIKIDSNRNRNRLYEFINVYGRYLLHLVISDDGVYIDVALLLESCPHLVTLEGPLCVNDKPVAGQFTKMKSLYLFNSNTETTKWFLENCPALEELTLSTEGDLKHIIDNPPLIMLNYLKRLDITFNSEQSMSYETITQFIDKCSNLKKLGILEYWNSHYDITEQIKEYVRKMNYKLYVC